jgi:hypothetical protein
MKTAKTALVIVECPPNMSGDKTWIDFLNQVRIKSQTEKNNDPISAGVWLLHLNKGLGLLSLSRIVEAAHEAKFPIRVLFFEKTPNWTKYPPDAKPSSEAKPD